MRGMKRRPRRGNGKTGIVERARGGFGILLP